MASSKETEAEAKARGKTVKREIRTTTIGSGADAVKRITTIETTSYPNGDTEVKTYVEETKEAPPSPRPPETDEAATGGGVTTGTQSHRKGKGPKPMKETNGQFAIDVLETHNKYRRLHGDSVGLKLNLRLSDMAQKWAENLVVIKKLQTNSAEQYNDEPVGQNVASKMSSGLAEYSGVEVVDQWYNESTNYNFENPESRKAGVRTGNFTQLVWKGSREIGVGRARSDDGHDVYVVVNYFPAGNFIGQFKENVMPKAAH